MTFQPTLTKTSIKMDEKEESDEEKLWDEGAFIETTSHQDIKKKMKTFHMNHDEDVNYNCKKCNKKISAHNRDWHDHMCDECFNKKYFKEE